MAGDSHCGGKNFVTLPSQSKYDPDPGSRTNRNKTHRTVQSPLDAFNTFISFEICHGGEDNACSDGRPNVNAVR